MLNNKREIKTGNNYHIQQLWGYEPSCEGKRLHEPPYEYKRLNKNYLFVFKQNGKTYDVYASGENSIL
ncbi:MAG: hypothetical protein AABY22_26805 [Nanoarchaeota archaeon]